MTMTAVFEQSQASRFFMAPTSVWSMKRPIAVISQQDRIEILKKPLKTMCLTLVPLGLLRRLPKKLGFFRSLADIFGHAQARELLHLAIYKLDQGGSMAAYGEWWKEVYLKNASPLSERISELLSAVSRISRLRHAAKLDKAKAEDVESLTYALDNTSISTYSKTIGDAAYGHAKRGS